MSDEPLFRFKGRATGKDPYGYYHVRWDLAVPISVLASNRAEANEKVWALLGSHTRHGSGAPGSGWTLIWDSIDEVPSIVAEES